MAGNPQQGMDVMPLRPAILCALLVIFSCALPFRALAGPVALAAKNGATVIYDQQAKTWEIANEWVRLKLGFDKALTVLEGAPATAGALPV